MRFTVLSVYAFSVCAVIASPTPAIAQQHPFVEVAQHPFVVATPFYERFDAIQDAAI